MSDDYNPRPVPLDQRIERIEGTMRQRSEQRAEEYRDLSHGINNLRQSVLVMETERRHSDARTSRIEDRLAAMEKMLTEKFEHLEDKIVSKERVKILEWLVYGLSGMLLAGIITAILKLVIK